MFAEARGYAIVKAFAMIIGVFLLSLVLSAIAIFILSIKMKGKKKWILRILLPFLLAMLTTFLWFKLKFG